jgi:hypothetical protein
MTRMAAFIDKVVVQGATAGLMRIGSQRVAAWLAIASIVLQLILPGVAQATANSAPSGTAGVICHSETSDPGSPAPQSNAIEDCCANCVLCNPAAMASPPAAPAIIGASLPPSDVIAFPAFSTPPANSGGRINLARGPPLTA